MGILLVSIVIVRNFYIFVYLTTMCVQYLKVVFIFCTTKQANMIVDKLENSNRRIVNKN